MVDATRSELYGYDALNQLTSFARGTLNSTKDAIAGMPSATQSWNFDPLGNWDAVTTDGVTETRDHNAQNELTTAGSSGLTYDNNGNMTTDQAGRQFVWDAWNRLVEVKDSGGTTLKTYGYDGTNRRVTETAGTTTTTLYYSDQWQVLQEQVAGATTAQYVWSPVYVDAMVLRDRDTDADGTLDERLWAIQDANFNVVALTDDSGAVVERYQQTPFGVVTVLDASGTVLTASAYGWAYTHQGLRFDADAGLFDNRWRWYSPSLGRFVSTDPLDFAAGDVNERRYVGNNPAISSDPSGLQADAPIIIGSNFLPSPQFRSFSPDKPGNVIGNDSDNMTISTATLQLGIIQASGRLLGKNEIAVLEKIVSIKVPDGDEDRLRLVRGLWRQYQAAAASLLKLRKEKSLACKITDDDLKK